MELILASTSKYRRQLLERLGLSFRSLAPRIDEENLKQPHFSPVDLAIFLASSKALSLCPQEPHATILGSDQLAACDGRILGKPGSVQAAVEQLLSLSGRTHELITAVYLWREGQVLSHVDITKLQMRSLTRAEIERYVSADMPTDCAGSYKLEQRGIALFKSIESADHSAIVGLPLIAVTTMLREFGFAIP